MAEWLIVKWLFVFRPPLNLPLGSGGETAIKTYLGILPIVLRGRLVGVKKLKLFIISKLKWDRASRLNRLLMGRSLGAIHQSHDE